MHYRNGRPAQNGDSIALLNHDGSGICAIGVLHGAKPGNDYCNGYIALTQNPCTGACLCDCLHMDDVAALLKSLGFTFHATDLPNAIAVFKAGTSEPASAEQIDQLLQRLNRPGLDKRPPGK